MIGEYNEKMKVCKQAYERHVVVVKASKGKSEKKMFVKEVRGVKEGEDENDEVIDDQIPLS